MQVAMGADEQPAGGEHADLIEPSDHRVPHVAERVERRLVAGEEFIELAGHRVRPGVERLLGQRRRRHVRPGRARSEREVHLGDHLAEPHRLCEERGVLIVHHRPALDRIHRTDGLGVCVEVAQRREGECPALGAVVQEALHEHERRGGVTTRLPHHASEHRCKVREAGGGERVGHLELLRRSGLDPAEMFEEDRVAHLD